MVVWTLAVVEIYRRLQRLLLRRLQLLQLQRLQEAVGAGRNTEWRQVLRIKPDD